MRIDPPIFPLSIMLLNSLSALTIVPIDTRIICVNLAILVIVYECNFLTVHPKLHSLQRV